MAERWRELGDFKGVDHFEAKFQVEGITSRANIYGSLDRGWSYYNFAAGSLNVFAMS